MATRRQKTLTPKMRMVIVRPAVDKNPLKRSAKSAGDRTVPDPACALRVSSTSLLGKHGELVIEHDGREYRLRITQNGKLILTA